MTGRRVKQSQYSPPKNPVVGQLYYDLVSETLRRWNGKDWTTEVKPGEIAENEKV
jgi:hypothetical protein